MPGAPLVVLTIAGSDSGAGAGLQADLKTFSALGSFGTTVVTAVTAQNTAEVRGVVVIDAPFVELQMKTVFDDMPVRAVKTGMLGSSENIALVGRWAEERRLPNLVVDPVLVASSGRKLLDDEGIDHYLRDLIPHALVITPNIHEAELLSGVRIDDQQSMVQAAVELSKLGPRCVVVKGGHLKASDAPDVLVCDHDVKTLVGRRVQTTNDHGTGCTLSAATAALLAQGCRPLDAITRAKQFVTSAIAGAVTWKLGAGHGPLDHFGWDR